ncbi:hypothetical protein HPB48_004179 [Haemaphysalis longicornis]|uniref:Uncharacterized protein n=1 Tax=Haemaphysalis longicornis TaxID=44386 RepID=A0A9J6GM00_HAELO|nr:hypothetical protein HPB48_004179 [Haemaphysalis longicornis]
MSALELSPLVNRVVEGCAEDLYKLSRFLCENPELALQEVKAHHRLCEFLEQSGFTVNRQHLLETAFRAEFNAPGGSNGKKMQFLVNEEPLLSFGQRFKKKECSMSHKLQRLKGKFSVLGHIRTPADGGDRMSGSQNENNLT